MRTSHAVLAGGGGLIAAGLGAGVYGLVHSHSYVLRRRSLLIPGQARPLRILHISDAHTLARHTKRLRFIRDLAETSPDLVVLTGDMIAEPDAVAPVLAALDELLEVPGVFVFGSNDYVAPTFKNPLAYLGGPSNRGAKKGQPDRRPLPWRDMRAEFKARGWADLTNARAQMSVAGWDLEFVGVDDPHMHLDRFPDPVDGPAAGDSAGTARSAGAAGTANSAGKTRPASPTGNSGKPATNPGDSVGKLGDAVVGEQPRMRIGVAHAPYQRVLNQMVADGCSLIFAGHTHGGQVCLPPHRALVSNCDLDPSLASGLFDWPRFPDSEEPIKGDGAAIAKEEAGGAWVQVSAGIGSATYMPLRTFCPPEAILLDVVPVAAQPAGVNSRALP